MMTGYDMKNKNMPNVFYQPNIKGGIMTFVVSSLSLSPQAASSAIVTLTITASGQDVDAGNIGRDGGAEFTFGTETSATFNIFGNNALLKNAYNGVATFTFGPSVNATKIVTNTGQRENFGDELIAAGNGINYLGIKFVNSSNDVNYGWVKMSLSGNNITGTSVVLYYNDVDNQGVKLTNGVVSVVPEPATIGALAGGAAVVLALRRRRKQKKAKEAAEAASVMK